MPKKRNSFLDALALSDDLIIYTNDRTKPITAELNASKVKRALVSISQCDDPDQIRNYCRQAASSISTNQPKMGFSKSAYRDFGQDLRNTAKSINKKIRKANNVNFKVEPEKRFLIMDEIMEDISDFKHMLHLCVDAKYISPNVAYEWTGKVIKLENAIKYWREACRILKDKNSRMKNSNYSSYSINYYRY